LIDETDQAQTALDYMSQAIADIDGLLGKGYAKEHPELIAAYMQTVAAITRDASTEIGRFDALFQAPGPEPA
jgi:hypothetical protein